MLSASQSTCIYCPISGVGNVLCTQNAGLGVYNAWTEMAGRYHARITQTGEGRETKTAGGMGTGAAGW